MQPDTFLAFNLRLSGANTACWLRSHLVLHTILFALVLSPGGVWAAPAVTSVAVGAQSSKVTAGATGTVTYNVVVTRGGITPVTVVFSAIGLPSGIGASF